MIGIGTIRFLRDLAANNSKAFFDENRNRYEGEVKGPFRDLCREIVGRLHGGEVSLPGIDPARLAEIPENPREAVMRINRDLRFSKDKSPYHTYLRAAFVPGGRKSGNAGLYLTIEPDTVGAGGGVYKAPRAFEPGLPALEGLELDPPYRSRLDEVHEKGLKKDGFLVAIISMTPEDFVALPDQAAWVIERFGDVAPLIGRMW